MITFPQFDLQDPQEDKLLADFEGVLDSLEGEASSAVRLDKLEAWERARRSFQDWRALVGVRFHQDTQDEARRKRRERSDELDARITTLDAKIKRAFIAALPDEAVEARVGDTALARWAADVKSGDPALEEDLIAESKLGAAYTALRGGAKVEFEGQTYPIPAMGKFAVDSDRERRLAAHEALWSWWASNGGDVDRIYDELVTLRHGMAQRLGLSSFVELGYLRMHRVDYTREDVGHFRTAVQEHVVPLAARLFADQAKRLGVDPLRYADEGVHHPEGNPEPVAGPEGLAALGQQAFGALHPELGSFFDLLVERQLLDLPTRPGKAGGGFCSFLPETGLPFIFANCNGTQGDVRVLVHEAGHAFQMYQSRTQDLMEKIFPTYESCEVHSMGLEFLSWPQMETFFGADADRFRRSHLIQALCFLPYGVAVDHFQHEVYDNPDWTPAERHAAWKRMEELYLPWRSYGDVEYANRGTFWQRQMHIVAAPFYYIDYTLAQTCALQFWVRSLDDHAGAMEEYVALCKRGGTLPFQAMARSANLTSPFDPGCLADVAARAAAWLES